MLEYWVLRGGVEGRGQQGDPQLREGLSTEPQGHEPGFTPPPPASTPGHPLLDTCPDALSTSGQRSRTKNRVRGSLSELIIHETQKALALLLPLVRGSCLNISQTLRLASHENKEESEPPGQMA